MISRLKWHIWTDKCDLVYPSKRCLRLKRKFAELCDYALKILKVFETLRRFESFYSFIFTIYYAFLARLNQRVLTQISTYILITTKVEFTGQKLEKLETRKWLSSSWSFVNFTTRKFRVSFSSFKLHERGGIIIGLIYISLLETSQKNVFVNIYHND